MPISQLALPYPDFQNLQIIDPDKFDANNLAIKNKLDETLGVVNVQELNFNNYYTKSNMQVDGQSNLHWNNVTNKPVLADASWKGYASSKATLPLTGNTIGDIRCVLSDSTNDALNEPTQWHCVSTTGTVDQQWKMNGYSGGHIFKLFNDTNTYINSLDYNNVKLSGNQTIYDTKTFVSSPVVPSPASSNSATNKSYVDGLDASSVKLTGNQSISGVKAFASSPTVPTPSSSIDATNKSYVDNLDSTNVKVSGAQSISGVKTFSSSPTVPTPSLNTDASNKLYVDNSILTHKSEQNAHQAVNVSYDKTGTNLVATNTNSAINELAGKIVAIETVNVNAEVVSARTSTIYNQTFANLDSRFEYIEDRIESPTLLTSTITPSTLIQSITNISSGIIDTEIGGATLYNAPINGDFANGTTGWVVGQGTQSVSNKINTVTGNGSGVSPFISRLLGLTNQTGNKIKAGALKVRVTNSLCTKLQLILQTSGGVVVGIYEIPTPTANAWYDLSNILTLSFGVVGQSLTMFISHYYVDAATANGKAMEVDGNAGVFAIPITGTAYESKTNSEINAMLGEPFEGLKSTNELSILSRGKQLFDELLEIGTIDTSTGANATDTTIIRSTNFQKVKALTQYILSNDKSYTNVRVYYYDKNKTFISSASVGTIVFTTPSNATFVRFRLVGTDLTTKATLNEGSTALPYEPYKNSILSVNCTDDSKFALSKLPNGVQNEVNQAQGYISAVKRNESPYTLQSSDLSGLYNGLTNNVIYQTSELLQKTPSSSFDTGITVEGMTQVAFSNNDNVADRGKFMTAPTTKRIYFIFATGTTLEQAQSQIAGKKIIYPLLTPVFIPYEDFPEYGINVDGALASHSGYTNVSYEADIVPDASVTYAVDISASIGTLSQSVANCFDRLDDNETRINTIEDMFVSSNATLPLTPTTSIQSVIDSYDGIVDAEIGGVTLQQQLTDSSVYALVSNDTPGSRVYISPGGSLGVGALYSTSYQKFDAIVGNKYFIKFVAKTTQPGRLTNSVGLAYSDGTLDTVGSSGESVTSAYGIVTSTKTLKANAFVRTGSTTGLIERDCQVLIPLTGTPYENYTAEQMNAIVSKHFEGLKSTNELSILSRGKNLNTSELELGGYDQVGNKFVIAGYVRSKDRIRAKGSTTYTFSGRTVADFYICEWDKNGSFITRQAKGSVKTFTTSLNTHEIALLFDNTSTENDIMLNEGSTAIPYEPYKNSILSVNCTDDTKFALSKLPNGVQNEINQVSGYISSVKRNQLYALTSGDIVSLTNGTNVQWLEVTKKTDDVLYNNSTTSLVTSNQKIVPNFRPGDATTPTDTAGNEYSQRNWSNTTYRLILPLGTYADVNAARTDLVTNKQTKIVYQRATPVFIPFEDFDQYGLNVDGALASYDGYSNLSYSANIIPDVTLQYPRNISASIDGLSNSLSFALTQTTNHEQRLDAIDDLIPTKLDVSAYTSTDINTKLSNESTISFNPTFGSNTAWSTLNGDWQAYKVGRMVTIVGDLTKGAGTDPVSNKLIVQNLPTSLKGATNNRSFYSGLAELISNPQVNRYIEASYDYDGTLGAMTIIFKDLNSTALGDRDLLASSISANTSIKFSITYFI